MTFEHGMHFEAQMHFEIVRTDEGWRVTTRADRYRFAVQGREMFLMHWHPSGNSPYRLPHLHISFDGAPIDEGESKHLPSPRIAYEHAIGWILGNRFVESARDDWQSVLDETLAQHLQRRSWSSDPDEAISG